MYPFVCNTSWGRTWYSFTTVGCAMPPIKSHCIRHALRLFSFVVYIFCTLFVFQIQMEFLLKNVELRTDHANR